MIQRHTKVDAEVILSVSIPVLAVCTGASSLFTSTLFTTQNIASAALYCTFIAALAVLGWWLLSCAFAIRYLYRIRSGLTQIVNRDERGTLLLPRFMRNAVLTLGGISLGLGAVLSPAQAAQQTETASLSPQSAPVSVSAPALVGTPATTTATVNTAAVERMEPTPFYPPTKQQTDPTLSPFFGGGTGTPHVQPASAQQGSEYVVVRGDCLWNIAQRILGPNASNATILEYTVRIHQNNRSTIGDNPDLVLPGQRILLPS